MHSNSPRVCIPVYRLHQQEFNNFARAHKDHPALEPFGGGLQGVWQPMFNNEQLLVLLIMVPVTTRVESVKPTDVITTFRNIGNMAGWMQWFNASCDMMVFDAEGNKDTDDIKRKVIYAKYTITASRACETLCEKVKTITTLHRGPGGAVE